MRLGTKSLLFGAHAFWLHPWFVALGWWKLYGFSRVEIGSAPVHTSLLWGTVLEEWVPVTTSLWDRRLWLAFFLHDIGYWHSPNMDGPEGKLHPRRGAEKMGAMYGEPWYTFTLYHSRSFARKDNRRPSALCAADKLAFNLTPRWLYLLMTRATGEIREYMTRANFRVYDKWARRYWHMAVADSFEREYPTSTHSRSSNAKA